MYIVVNNKRINIESFGHGKETVVFVHGWGGSIESLRKLANLASEQSRVVIFDLPGFGKSDLPDKNWGVESYAELIVGLFRHLRLNDVVYFGHSFGGSLGIYIASHSTGIIKKLILCNSALIRTNKNSVFTKTLKRLFQLIPFANRLEWPIKWLYYRLLFPNSDLIRFPHLEANFKKIMSQDLTPYLSKIQAETLILWGEIDLMTPLNFAKILRSEIKKSRLKIYPNIGHNLPLQYPALIYEEVKKFI